MTDLRWVRVLSTRFFFNDFHHVLPAHQSRNTSSIKFARHQNLSSGDSQKDPGNSEIISRLVPSPKSNQSLVGRENTERGDVAECSEECVWMQEVSSSVSAGLDGTHSLIHSLTRPAKKIIIQEFMEISYEFGVLIPTMATILLCHLYFQKYGIASFSLVVVPLYFSLV